MIQSPHSFVALLHAGNVGLLSVAVRTRVRDPRLNSRRGSAPPPDPTPAPCPRAIADLGMIRTESKRKGHRDLSEAEVGSGSLGGRTHQHEGSMYSVASGVEEEEEEEESGDQTSPLRSEMDAAEPSSLWRAWISLGHRNARIHSKHG